METCRERLLREHPEAVNPHALGGCIGCPATYGYAGAPYYCGGGEEMCDRCWDRKAPEKSLIGRWKVEVTDYGIVYKCPECGRRHFVKTGHCNYCGTDMRGE